MARGGRLTRSGSRLLLLSLVFPPDEVSTAQLFGELVEDLIALGWDVTVLTTTPHYNPPAEVERRLTARWGGLLMTSSFHGATVIHTAMPLKGTSVIGRIAAWLRFHVLSVLAALRETNEADVILAPSPPLTIGLAAWLIGEVKRAPFIYNVQELYPDTAVSLGALKEGWLLYLLRRVEAFVYRRAYAVTTIAPGMARAIARRTSDPKKVRLIPNFVDTRIITPQARDNPFAREFDLRDCFSVVYAGNMGPAQGLETLLEAAELTRREPSIRYVLVGAGTSKDALEQFARTRQLSNVQFIPQQPYARVPDIYGSSDLCVVPLVSGLASEAVPSKVYRILAAERRILAITNPISDLAAVVRESNSGIVVEPGNPRILADAILAAAGSRNSSVVPRSREFVVQHFDRPIVVNKYSELLREAAASRSPRVID